MCSTCAATVFGATSGRRRWTGFVMPSATSRATSYSRAVSGAHGSAGMPRRPASASTFFGGADERRRPQAGRVVARGGRQPTGLEPLVRSGETTGEVDLAQVPSQRRFRDRQPASAASSAARARRSIPGRAARGPARGRSPAACRDRPVRDALPDRLDPACRGERVAEREVGPATGHEERVQVRRVVDGCRGGQPRLAELHCGGVLAAQPGHLREAPQRRRQPLQLVHLLAEAPGLVEHGLGGRPVAASEPDVAEDVERRDPGRDPAAAVGERVPGDLSAAAHFPVAHNTWPRCAAM